jgi:hypothetical protein
MANSTFAIATCARWEKLNIIEWCNYHYSIGFDTIYLYCNDDNAAELYEKTLIFRELEGKSFFFFHWEKKGDQLGMYNDFISNYSSNCTWFALIDVDEFITLPGFDDKIYKFIDFYNDQGDIIYLHWLNFGSSGYVTKGEESLLLTRNRRTTALDPHTKCILRSSSLHGVDVQKFLESTGVSFVHFWDAYPIPNVRIIDSLGNPIPENFAVDFPRSSTDYLSRNSYESILRRSAYISHYQFKSEDEFIKRANRAGFAGQEMWRDIYKSGKYKNILESLNHEEDNYLRNYWLKTLSA